jgi:hypothetical protein
MDELEEHRTAILYCPHCGNRSVQTRLLTLPYEARFYSVPDGKQSLEPAIYSVVKCETCNEVLVYNVVEQFADYSETGFGDLVYPQEEALSDAVPDGVRNMYREAALVKNLSPTAFAVLARRVLEEICQDRGVQVENLAKALSKLADDGVIPKTLSEATTLIRLVGNAGAHASGASITMLQVWAIDDFMKAVIEYIYVAPKKIEEFKSRFKHFSERPRSPKVWKPEAPKKNPK